MTVSPVCFCLDPIKQTEGVILGLWLLSTSRLLGLLGSSGLLSLLLLLLGELLCKQGVPPGLLGPCVLLLSSCPLWLLPVVIVRLLLWLLPVVIELLLPVVVVELLLLLSVIVGLLPVVLSVVLLLPVVLLPVSSLPRVLLLPVEACLELLLLRSPGGRLPLDVISYRSNVDVSCEARYVLATTIPSDRLRHPAVGHCVSAESGLCSPVPESSLGSGTTVAAVPQLPPVALTGGVGRPCAVGRAH